MYKIIKNDTGRVFPDNALDEGYLDDYIDSHISDLSSTLGVNSMLGNSFYRIGDSDICVRIIFTGTRDEPGRREFEQYVKDLTDLIREALPSMSEKYKNFYGHFVKDYEENGLNMPFWD